MSVTNISPVYAEEAAADAFYAEPAAEPKPKINDEFRAAAIARLRAEGISYPFLESLDNHDQVKRNAESFLRAADQKQTNLKLVTDDGEFTDAFDPDEFFHDKDIDLSILGNYLDTDFNYVQIIKTKPLIDKLYPFFDKIFTLANTNFEALQKYPSLAQLSLEQINSFCLHLLWLKRKMDINIVWARAVHHANLPYFSLNQHDNQEISTPCASLRLTYEKAHGVYFDPEGPRSKSNFVGVRSQYVLSIVGRYKVGLSRNEFIFWANIIKQSCEVNPKKQIVPDFILASRMGFYGFSDGRNDEVFQQKLFDYKKILHERGKSKLVFAIMERLLEIKVTPVTRYMPYKLTERDQSSAIRPLKGGLPHNMHVAAAELNDFTKQQEQKFSDVHFDAYYNKNRRTSKPLSDKERLKLGKSSYNQFLYRWIAHPYPSADVSVRIRQEILSELQKHMPIYTREL